MDLKKLLINRLRSFNQIFLLLLALSLASLSIADDAPSINDKIYTKKQAKTGEALYKDNCLICHNKKYFRPVFKTWENQSLGTFFLVMSSSMPEDNPGSWFTKNISIYWLIYCHSTDTLQGKKNYLILLMILI